MSGESRAACVALSSSLSGAERAALELAARDLTSGSSRVLRSLEQSPDAYTGFAIRREGDNSAARCESDGSHQQGRLLSRACAGWQLLSTKSCLRHVQIIVTVCLHVQCQTSSRTSARRCQLACPMSFWPLVASQTTTHLQMSK
jgi:hypothetical protein